MVDESVAAPASAVLDASAIASAATGGAANATPTDNSISLLAEIDKMKEAMKALTQKILQLQGDGDYAATAKFIDEMGVLGPQLQADLERVNRAGIPTDIVFQQGVKVLGLEK